MKKLCAGLIVIVILVVGLGFYRGWFSLSRSNPEADSNKVNVGVTVDRGKMNEDAETVKKRTTEITGTATEKATEPGDGKKTE
jgi:hypothetical protein